MTSEQTSNPLAKLALARIQQRVDDRFDPSSSDEKNQYKKYCFIEEILDRLIEQGTIALPAALRDDLDEYFSAHPFSAEVGKSKINIYGSALISNGESGYQLHLFACDYSPKNDVEPFSLDDYKSVYVAAYSFWNLIDKGRLLPKLSPANKAVYAAAKKLNAHKDQVSAIRVWVITNKLFTGTKAGRSDKTGIETTAQVIDLSSIADIFSEKISIDQNFESVGGLPCVTVPAGQDPQHPKYHCYLTAISGKALAQLYSMHGTALVQANVRAYLGENKINKGIQETVTNEPENFLAYNNGLVIFATKVSRVENRINEIQGLQIINGGQTTASLYHYWLKITKSKKADSEKDIELANLESVRVCAKIVVLDEKETDEDRQAFQEKVSEAANFQNKVMSSDLSANKPFHINFESIANTLQTPNGEYWFYERARGLYTATLNKKRDSTEKRRYQNNHPKEKVVTKANIALAQLIWEGNAIEAARGQENAFKIFNDRFSSPSSNVRTNLTIQDVKGYLCRWILFSNLEQEMRRRAKSLGIGNPRVPIIYALKLFSERYGENVMWDSIWNNQAVPGPLMDFLIDLTKEVHRIMQETMGTYMIAMWGRQPQCEAKLRERFSFDSINCDVKSTYGLRFN